MRSANQFSPFRRIGFYIVSATARIGSQSYSRFVSSENRVFSTRQQVVRFCAILVRLETHQLYVPEAAFGMFCNESFTKQDF